MASQGKTVVRLSQGQLDALIDREARRRLHMSGDQFRKRLAANRLPKDKPVAVHDIAMLLKLASANGIR